MKSLHDGEGNCRSRAALVMRIGEEAALQNTLVNCEAQVDWLDWAKSEGSQLVFESDSPAMKVLRRVGRNAEKSVRSGLSALKAAQRAEL